MSIYCKRDGCIYCQYHNCMAESLALDANGQCVTFVLNEATSAMTLVIKCDPYDLVTPVGLVITGNTTCHEQLLKSLGYSIGEEPLHGLFGFLKRSSVRPRVWRICCSFEEAERHIAEISEYGLTVENCVTDEMRSVWVKGVQRASMTDQERQRAALELVPPEVPTIIKGWAWNGTVYNFKNSLAIYLGGEPLTITDASAEELRRYWKQKTEYERRRKELRAMA